MKNCLLQGTMILFFALVFGCQEPQPIDTKITAAIEDTVEIIKKIPTLDTLAYNKLMLTLSNGDTSGRWPKKAIYPNLNAILPYHRIIAFYGNLYSKGMGILGELPETEMLDLLQTEVKKWAQADTLTPVLPALHYIAVTAQIDPGKNRKYRQRMPDEQIDKVLEMAKKINALVFLDIQIGLSSLEEELPILEKYLKLPNVHLGIDPEFAMQNGVRPGKRVGVYSAADINYAAKYLETIVKANQLSPKILVVHRFTKGMVTNYEDIQPLPDVQIVMHMDGWGGPAKKKATYRQTTFREPVQFTGFKIFYKHDTYKVNQASVMTPEELLGLVPRPIYIQYQ